MLMLHTIYSYCVNAEKGAGGEGGAGATAAGGAAEAGQRASPEGILRPPGT